MIYKVIFADKCLKQMRKLPKLVVAKVYEWADVVEEEGLEEVRKIRSYHDEPLHGKRQGQRSIRLNRSWRAIYVIKNDIMEFIEVQEVTHHDYR